MMDSSSERRSRAEGNASGSHQQSGETRDEEQASKAPGQSTRFHRVAVLFDACLAGLLLLAANPVMRHWLAVIVANICILGGIIAAPIVSMVAWIGLVLPTHALLHQLAPMLVATSLIWFCMAIVGAHVLRLDAGKPD